MITTINRYIEEHLNIYFGEDNNIMKTITSYVIENGKRVRPAISFDIYNTLGKDNLFKYTFLAIEYIHSSSLIIDDLPCMDDALTRRNNICIHKKYGEAIAQLTTAILLSLSAHCISYEINSLMKDNLISIDKANEITMYFLSKFSEILKTASHGQLLDLENSDKDIGLLLKDISSKITEIFFTVSFELPWICVNGFKHIDKIKSLSHNFSMAFQIIDDICDIEEDLAKNKKNVNQNYALRYGIEKTVKDANTYLNIFSEQLIELDLNSEFFDNLIKNLRTKLSDFH